MSTETKVFAKVEGRLDAPQTAAEEALSWAYGAGYYRAVDAAVDFLIQTQNPDHKYAQIVVLHDLGSTVVLRFEPSYKFPGYERGDVLAVVGALGHIKALVKFSTLRPLSWEAVQELVRVSLKAY